MSGVYIHIPFCKQACTYCDFFFSTSLAGKAAMVTAITSEIGKRYNYLEKGSLESIYFGGGTPSLLTPDELGTILNTLAIYFNWRSDAEITLEVNPDDISKERLSGWRSLGINRLSIGLQSFDDNELKWMNRAHTSGESVNSVKLAQDAGFNNITIDLIYGSKFQDLTGWEATLNKAISLNTQHISSYNLTLEPKTVLGTNHRKGKEPAVSDELSRAQFLLMSESLAEAGFVHYEISNFGKPGFFAKHNSNYWLQQHYLGLGPSAHSFNGVSRQWNVRNNAQYVKALNEEKSFFEKEELSVNDRYNEYILTRLRTIWGCNLHEMERLFGNDLALHFKKSVRNKLHQLNEAKGIYTLTTSARLMADGIASDLFI